MLKPFLVFIASMVVCISARADLIAFNDYTNGTVDNGFADFGPSGLPVGSFEQGQEFTAAATGSVSQIYASIYDEGSSSTMTLFLFFANGPVVNGIVTAGTFLGTYTAGTINPSSGGGNSPSIFTGTTVPLDAGFSYWLIGGSGPGENYAWAAPKPSANANRYQAGHSPQWLVNTNIGFEVLEPPDKTNFH